MKSIMRPGWLGLLFSLILAGGVRAADGPDAYQQAVNAYVEAAGKELQAMKTQTDQALQNANEPKKAAYKDFLEQLEEYEKAYEHLKNVAPKDFDLAKARYEKERNETVKSLGKVKTP